MFPTVSRVRRLKSYEDAKQAYDAIKPLRGSNLRPLGARRDKHYQIVRHESITPDCTYSARLYQTDVITYFPDGRVVIEIKNWATALTMQFVTSVLGIRTYRTRGTCVFVVNGVNFSLKGANSKLVLRLNEEGRYSVVDAPAHRQWALNRTAANALRASVSGFRTYLRSFVSLRTTTQKSSRDEYETISFSMKELIDVLGVVKNARGVDSINIEGFRVLKNKWHYARDEYESRMARFYELIHNDQPEEHRHINYLKAAVGLFAGQRPYILLEVDDQKDVQRLHFDPRNALENLDTILFMWRAHEVLVLKEVPTGKIPNNKYDQWLVDNTR